MSTVATSSSYRANSDSRSGSHRGSASLQQVYWYMHQKIIYSPSPIYTHKHKQTNKKHEYTEHVHTHASDNNFVSCLLRAAGASGTCPLLLSCLPRRSQWPGRAPCSVPHSAAPGSLLGGTCSFACWQHGPNVGPPCPACGILLPELDNLSIKGSRIKTSNHTSHLWILHTHIRTHIHYISDPHIHYISDPENEV